MAEIEKLKPKQLALPAPGQPLALPAPGPTDPIPPKLSSDPNKVFEVTEAPVIDIGTIVSKRLNAQRKLQENPEVSEMLCCLIPYSLLISKFLCLCYVFLLISVHIIHQY